MNTTKNASILTMRGVRLAVLMAALLLSLALLALSQGIAHADNALAECPVNEPNVGCRFDGTVGPGNVIVTYHFKYVNGGYDTEIQPSTCRQETCPITSVAVADPNKIPANFEISADAPVRVVGVYPVR